MAGKRPISKEDKLLAAISTLKRVVGAPDCPAENDRCDADGLMAVYTTDPDSAQILANLLAQSLMKIRGHTEKYWSQPKNQGEFHDQIKVLPEADNTYRIHISFPPSWIGLYTDNVTQKTESLIAPGKKPAPAR